MAEGLLDKANIILTPTGYKAGTMYNVAPIESPYEDFDFARASVASRVNSSGLVEMVGRTIGSNLVQNGDFSELGTDLVQNGTFDLGSELVTNGDFATDSDWTKGTGWSISDGSASYDGSGTGYQFILQGITTTTGSTYKINFDVLSSTGSNLNIVDFGAVRVNQTHLTAGNYTYYAQADASSENLVIYANGTDTFSIDNVSVKEVPDWTLGGAATIENDALHLESATNEYSYARQDISSLAAKTYKIQLEIKNYVSGACQVGFTGSSPNLQNLNVTSDGTYTAYLSPNANGNDLEISREFGGGNFNFDVDNVVVQELDPNDYWSLGTGWSIGDGKATSNASANSYLNQSVYTIGNTYKLTFEVLEGTIELRSAHYSSGVGYYATGTHTVYVIPTTADTYFYVYTGFGQTSITNIVVQEIIDTNNIPRINYDSNGENGHWLLEPTSTNLVPYSEDFENGYTKVNSSVDLNDAVAPDGTTTANKFNSTATGSSISKSNANSSALFHTVSIFLKKGTIDIVTLTVTGGSPAISASTTVNLTSGTITASSGNGSITPTITNYGNDWYRITASSTSNGNVANPTISIVNSSTTASGYFYMWGLQFEGLSYATSYIPTLTGSTETRATETATGAGSADLINSTEGVLYAEIATLVNGGANRYISLSDNTTSNRLNVIFSSNTDRLTISGVGNIGSFTNINFFSYTQNVYNKIAIKYSSSGVKLFVNGSLEGSNSDNVSWTSNTLTTLDFSLWNQSTAPFEGKVKALAVFNTALTDAELTELTS